MRIDEQTLRDALDEWGRDAQLRQLQEECCELAAAVNRLWRNRRGSFEEFIDEVADVSIVIAQMHIEFGDAIQAAVDHKMARLRKRIDGEDS